MVTSTMSPKRAVGLLTARMRQLAHKEGELRRLEGELNARLEAAKGLYTDRLTTLQNAVDALRDQTEAFCCAQREVLFGGAARSVQTAYGRAGFRRSGIRLRLDDAQDAESVCAGLRGLGLDRFVRVREEPDKAAIKSALGSGEVEDSLLARCGIHAERDAERFYCVLDRVQGEGART